MSEIVRYNRIQDYCQRHGLKCLNDMVTVIDFSSINEIEYELMSLGFYAIWLKTSFDGQLTYGLRKYKYINGSVIFVAPNQIFGISSGGKGYAPSGHGLLFNPDFLEGNFMGEMIAKCEFFSYETNEALNVSDIDRRAIINCMSNIKEELLQHNDEHTQQIVLSNTLVLLAHCTRAYHTQYNSRHVISNDLYDRFNKVLEDYFDNHLPEKLGLPTVQYCAGELSLSPNYFGDIIKRVSGKSAKEHIQNVTIEHVKQLLLETHLTISEVAYHTGFKYPHHLSRVFKKLTGLSPYEYRKQMRQNLTPHP